MAPLRVLVTGGAGFIGQRLVAGLMADGHEVHVLDSLIPQVHGGARPRLPCQVTWADVRDPDALGTAMRGVDVVHHLAAETGVGQSQYEIARYVSANTHGTATVLQAACEEGVRQVVIASSRAVYGEGQYRCPRCDVLLPQLQRHADDMAVGRFDLRCPTCGSTAVLIPTSESAAVAPVSIYGVTKLQQEQLAATVAASRGVHVTLLRLFNVFGPGQSLANPYVGVLGTFVRRLRAGRPVELYEDGQMVRDYVFVDDVADVFRRCTGNDRAYGRTWNVGTGSPVTLQELVLGLARALGTDAAIEISGRYRLGDVRHAVADVSRLHRELGAASTVPFQRGLEEFVAWVSENPGDAADDLAQHELASRNLLRQSV